MRKHLRLIGLVVFLTAHVASEAEAQEAFDEFPCLDDGVSITCVALPEYKLTECEDNKANAAKYLLEYEKALQVSYDYLEMAAEGKGALKFIVPKYEELAEENVDLRVLARQLEARWFTWKSVGLGFGFGVGVTVALVFFL